MLIDRYGFGWMFNCELPKTKAKATTKPRPQSRAAKKRR